MNINDVKEGDRCWVAKEFCECDEHGQNATVTGVSNYFGEGHVKLDVDSANYIWRTVGVDVFWRKPEAPPKPKRKVTCMADGVVKETLKCYADNYGELRIDFRTASLPNVQTKCTVTWEEER